MRLRENVMCSSNGMIVLLLVWVYVIADLTITRGRCHIQCRTYCKSFAKNRIEWNRFLLKYVPPIGILGKSLNTISCVTSVKLQRQFWCLSPTSRQSSQMLSCQMWRLLAILGKNRPQSRVISAVSALPSMLGNFLSLNKEHDFNMKF